MCPDELETIIQSGKRIASSKPVDPEYETWIFSNIISFGMKYFIIDPDLETTVSGGANGLLCMFFSKNVFDYLHAKQQHGIHLAFLSNVNPFDENDKQLCLFKKFITILLDRESKSVRNRTSKLSTSMLPLFLQETPLLAENEICINIYNVKDRNELFSILDLNHSVKAIGYSLVNERQDGTTANHDSFVNPLARWFQDANHMFIDVHISNHGLTSYLPALLTAFNQAFFES